MARRFSSGLLFYTIGKSLRLFKGKEIMITSAEHRKDGDLAIVPEHIKKDRSTLAGLFQHL